MSIDDYIVQLESVIGSSPAVSSYNITIDRKTNDIAFVSGVIELRDDTTIDFKEYIESKESGIEKYMYSCNYRTHSSIIFRYDNSPDPRAKKLETFPHHKHLKNDEIVESQGINLVDVLKEIEGIYFVNE
ncbi:MAG TPA: DUF6516 family protein [Candidatus Brocadiales bacterium]|nr:DUF6516 family protein [Candidatus Brocadiales bacterium]